MPSIIFDPYGEYPHVNDLIAKGDGEHAFAGDGRTTFYALIKDKEMLGLRVEIDGRKVKTDVFLVRVEALSKTRAKKVRVRCFQCVCVDTKCQCVEVPCRDIA